MVDYVIVMLFVGIPALLVLRDEWRVRT